MSTFRRLLAALVALLTLVAGGAVAFPADPIDVAVEVFYDSSWNDITGYVFDRTEASIAITRGRGNESARCTPGRLSLQLNNRGGRFSPRNPSSPLYGKIGRNTPIRVQVTYNAVTYDRFHGEVIAWPSRWNPNGTDVWVPLEAAGILRRLGKSSRPQQSSLYRAMVGMASGDITPTEYWPLEDGANSRWFASAVGGQPGTGRYLDGSATALPVPAGHDGITGSAPSVLLGPGAAINLPVRPYTDQGLWAIQSAFFVDTGIDVQTGVIVELAGGSRVEASIIDGLGDNLALLVTVTNSSGGVVYSDNVDLSGASAVGEPLALVVADTDTGPGDDFVARVLDGLGTVRAELTTTNIGYAVVQAMLVFNDWQPGEESTGAGHAGLFADPAFDLDVDTVEGARAGSGWDAEPADERFAHLCAQAQVSSEVVGESSALMGPERTVARLQAMRDAEDVDQGFIFERRDDLGLVLRTNMSRYNQVPVELDYAAGHIYPPFEPEPDDLGLFNDRTVSRYNGSFARAVLEEGPLSIQDPPDGAGRSDDAITVNAYDDDQLEHLAGWRRHVGTWDAERYPRVQVRLAGTPSLIPTVVPLDSGDYLRITNLPAWLPPEDAELLIEGSTEVIRSKSWDITFNTSPAGPYNVVGRWALLSHELHSAINSAVTSIDIANTDVSQPMLATSAADIGSGYGITVGTEEMLLTAVAASTITFGATGTASTGASGSRTPGLPTGSASGNLILIFASTRNSGTGTVDTPTNWTRLNIFPTTSNCAVFGRIYDGVWTMPTVTFTGGAANEDTIAQSMRLAGKWHSVSNILVDSAPCLNTSAANITYPGLPKPICDNAIILYFAWKQDDYTSITGPGTEIQEASSAAGNDASQSWAYTIQTTATSVPSGVFTPTGGAAAISRGAVAALRCDYQTATVTRGVNGTTAASHSAGDAVTMTKPMRWGLV